MTHAENAHAALSATIGLPGGEGEWFLVDQKRIDAFAEVTEDRQFIHGSSMSTRSSARSCPRGACRSPTAS
jgi:acyl dehydratase